MVGFKKKRPKVARKQLPDYIDFKPMVAARAGLSAGCHPAGPLGDKVVGAGVLDNGNR